MKEFNDTNFFKVKEENENGQISISKKIKMNDLLDLTDPISFFIREKYNVYFPLEIVKKDDYCEVWCITGGKYPDFEKKFITISKFFLINDRNEEQNFANFLIK